MKNVENFFARFLKWRQRTVFKMAPEGITMVTYAKSPNFMAKIYLHEFKYLVWFQWWKTRHYRKCQEVSLATSVRGTFGKIYFFGDIGPNLENFLFPYL